jgi:predicted N-acetyltransferase YhbS
VTIMVAGIQSLAVAPQLRGTGLSSRLMAEAMEEAQRRGIEYGLLFCLPGLERFYASLGWIRTDEPVTMADETGQPVPLTQKNITMSIELSERPFPKGPIDLQGRDW